MVNALFRNLFSLVQKGFVSRSTTFFFSSSSSSSSSPSHSFTVNYLMNSCGLPLNSAISTSNKIKLDKKNSWMPDSVLHLLKSHGFSKIQIVKLINTHPALLLRKVEGNLKPKFDFLIKNGFCGAILRELIVRNPVTLSRALDSHIKPFFELLKGVVETEEKVIAALRRSSWLISDWKRIMKPNIEYLISEGVPISNVSQIIVMHPRTIQHKYGKMIYAVEYIKKLGHEPNTPIFIFALKVFLSMSESTWKRKFEVLKSLGWSEEQIVSAFQRQPFFLACSEEKLKRATDFFLNTVKLDLDVLIAYPKFMMFGIDQRLLPRYKVLKVLESKNLLKDKGKNVWKLTLTEKVFQKRYVLKHVDEVPELLQIYDCTVKNKSMVT
ncbi:transcription termination factor MTERF2, chloroplastic-like isoform X1 [Tripterygium wilfordii]|uniref:transcription termination factor MTERF2, chloroplastic-like isoform X1 n=1 Tax=Tripterygium wilfordii TaxID=458696 RepID=UPI0018F7EE02|nr:transcription termination factor MTERF2, chloroplastic-like isoform X1 [Tripterygium wilfordii]XP_038690172.1 transcription termination factor MTERF2, chloroplastic-like isoform X1 [Tripterygium wilfordii]